jgi:hypothetical protein
MSEPLRYQEAAAMAQARALLVRLSDFRQTARIPRSIRAEARALLRWMPTAERLRSATPSPLDCQNREESQPRQGQEKG